MTQFNPADDAIDRRILYEITRKKKDPDEKFSDESSESSEDSEEGDTVENFDPGALLR